jgi:hypothetical protein
MFKRLIAEAQVHTKGSIIFSLLYEFHWKQALLILKNPEVLFLFHVCTNSTSIAILLKIKKGFGFQN